MRLWGILTFLVPFIFLWGIWEPELAEGFLIRCPKFKVHCAFEEKNECTRHRDCRRREKCCMFACAKRCLDHKDVCRLPKIIGSCRGNVPRWWYNKETGSCTEFMYGGCQGNLNNFPTESVCTSICKVSRRSSWM
ncbi:WAP four-disulfide core domain protein 6A-like [Peromyscus maniculatus bairdii]|uniref:WAP four-disulfide core domain protein 6A-like n=1 Tax=Peromyscus maniculatus bairdii TaxID=230844 RepID=UPI00042AA94F